MGWLQCACPNEEDHVSCAYATRKKCLGAAGLSAVLQQQTGPAAPLALCLRGWAPRVLWNLPPVQGSGQEIPPPGSPCCLLFLPTRFFCLGGFRTVDFCLLVFAPHAAVLCWAVVLPRGRMQSIPSGETDHTPSPNPSGVEQRTWGRHRSSHCWEAPALWLCGQLTTPPVETST